MHEELRALDHNNTLDLVQQTLDMNVAGTKWIFKTKFKSDGSVEQHKACLVAQCYIQVSRIDFDVTFTPIIKHTTIRLIYRLQS